jgi:hypothetical protein
VSLRDAFARQHDRNITGVAEFELVVANLRIPETV